MLAPAPPASPRWMWRVVGVFLACALLSLAILAVGLPDLLVSLDEEDQAMRFGQPARVASLLAADALEGNHPEQAHGLARAALAKAPIDQQALTLFALTGPAERRGALLALSAALGWRDMTTQYWLAQAGMAAGNPQLFAQRIDALARQSDSPERIVPIIDHAIADPAVRQAMLARLATHPDWEPAYFKTLADGDPMVIAGRVALLDGLARMGELPARDDIVAFVNRIDALGFSRQGRALWVRYAAHKDGWSGYLYDGNFAYFAVSGAPQIYEWRFSGSPGVFAVSEADGDGRALNVHADSSASGWVIGQRLALAPGRYRLSGHAGDATDGMPDHSSGFVWSLSCGDQGVAFDGVGPDGPAVRPGAWTYGFVVPAGCADQWLALTIDPGQDARNRDVRISDVRITG